MVVNVDETKAALASKVRLQKVRKAKKMLLLKRQFFE